MKKIKIHKFNDQGLKAFKSFIEKTRSHEQSGSGKLGFPPIAFEPDNIEVISHDEIDADEVFNNRYEMAGYIIEKWPSISDKYFKNVGVWAWFSAIYFNQLRGKSTQRSEHFIPDEYSPATASQRLGYRHSVREPVFLRRKYDDNWCKLMLTGRKVNEMGQFLESCMGSQKITSSVAVRGVIVDLYQDKITKTIKPGATNKVSTTNKKSTSGKGALRRLINTHIPRLKKSFDVEVMDSSDIISSSAPEISGSKWAK